MEQRRNSKLVVVIALVALVVVVAGALLAYNAAAAGGPAKPDASAASQSASAASASSTSAQGGSSAYAFVTVSDPEGAPVTLEELSKDKVTVVNVWATWCPYCVDEMRDFQALYDKYGDKVQFVMLDSADSASEVSDAREYVAEQGFTFPVFYDDSWAVQVFFNVTAYPTTIVIDADGTVLSNRPGRIDTASFEEALASLA